MCLCIYIYNNLHFVCLAKAVTFLQMVLFLLVSRLIYWSSRVWPWFVFTRRTVATPLASLLGVKETVRLKAPHNPTLESYYCKTTKNPTQVCVCVQISHRHVFKKNFKPEPVSSSFFVPQTSILSLSKQTGCSERQVQRWFRRRRNQDRPSLLKKFREAR